MDGGVLNFDGDSCFGRVHIRPVSRQNIWQIVERDCDARCNNCIGLIWQYARTSRASTAQPECRVLDIQVVSGTADKLHTRWVPREVAISWTTPIAWCRRDASGDQRTDSWCYYISACSTISAAYKGERADRHWHIVRILQRMIAAACVTIIGVACSHRYTAVGGLPQSWRSGYGNMTDTYGDW